MAALSLDLRMRLFNYSLSHSIRETAAVFRVSPATVFRLQKLFYATGQLAPPPSHAGRPRVVSEVGELFLTAVLVEEPDLTLNELRERYALAYGVHVSLGAMHDTLKRLGLSRKKRPRTTPRPSPTPTRPTRNATTPRSIPYRSATGSIWTKLAPA
jgi:transposase